MSHSVAFSPDDTEDWGLPVAGPGLLLDVPREGRWHGRPALHLEAAPGHRLRLTSGGQPLLWARIDSGWWEQCGFLLGEATASRGLSPLSAAEVRDVPHTPGTERWWEAWTWRLGRALAESPRPVLYPGRWCLRPVQTIAASKASRYPISSMEWQMGEPPAAPHSPELVLRSETFWVEAWEQAYAPERRVLSQGALLPLRVPSPESDGRVKSWRKHARDGTLPPVLLLYVEILAKWLVLDGHDRLHAALLEGVPPPLVGLWPVFEKVLPSSPEGQEGVLRSAEFHLRAGETPSVVDRVNRMLLRNFKGCSRGTFTRAWPLRGGVEAWRTEVLAWRRSNAFPAEPQEWEWFVSPGR